MNKISGYRWIVMAVLGEVAMASLAHAAYTINTTTLNSYKAVHPKLLLDSSIVASLRADLANMADPKYPLWTIFKGAADTTAATKPPVFFVPNLNDADTTNNDTSQEGQRAAGDGLADLAFAYLMTKPATIAAQSIFMEAEESLTTLGASPNIMMITNWPSASCGRFIEPTGAGSSGAIGAQYTIATTAPGTSSYRIWLRCQANYTGINFQVQVDNLTPTTVTFTSVPPTWVWVDGGTVSLTPGHHVLSILRGTTTGAKIDKILVTNDSAYATSGPSGAGTEQHWLEAHKFTIQTPSAIAVKGSGATDDNLSANPSYLMTQTAHATAPATADITQSFQVAGGSYDIWVRFKVPYSTPNGQWFSVDAGAPTPFWLTSQTPMPWREWVWQKIVSNTSLAAGSHSISMSGWKVDTSKSPPIGSSFDRFLVTTASQPAPVDPNKYIAALRNYAKASCGYPTWGAKVGATPGVYDVNDGTDLAAGVQLMGLALAYDWCYADLSAADQRLIKDKLYDVGLPAMSGGSTGGRFWTTQYYNNHRYINMAGLGAAAMALYGDPGIADATVMPWLTDSVSRFGVSVDGLNTTVLATDGSSIVADGFNQEGVGYYEYGMASLLRYTAMARKIMGVALDDGAWFQQNPIYRLAFSLPMNSWKTDGSGSNTSIDFADGGRTELSGANYMLRRMATLIKASNPKNASVAQWLADQLDARNANAKGGDYCSLLWYNDPAITSLSPTAAGLATPTATMQYFADYDTIVSRSGWDGSESVVAYQCGPFLGHRVQALEVGHSPYVDRGAGHAHPAANNFCLFGSGDWLIRNDGYTMPKYTRQLNSLLVDGVGQLGEGGDWFNASAAGPVADSGGVLNPSIKNNLCLSTASFDYMVGDAAKAYPAAAGVTKFTRHLLYYKPDVLVVVDDVALSAAKPLELRFFPEAAVSSVNATTYTATGTNAKLMVNLLTPSSSTLGTGMQGMQPKDKPTEERLYLSVRPPSSVATWGTATAFTWSAAAGSPRQVTMVTDDSNSWKFRVGGTSATMVLNRTSANGGLDKARLVTVVEAEAGNFPSGTNMQAFADATASGSNCASTKASMSGSPAADITFALTMPSSFSLTPTYTIWARCKAANTSSDGFYVALDGYSYVLKVVPSPYNTWNWVQLFSGVSASAHTLNVLHGDANCKIDQILVTDDAAFVPAGAY